MQRTYFSHSGIWADQACGTCAEQQRCCEITFRVAIDPGYSVSREWCCTQCIDQRFGSAAGRMHGDTEQCYRWPIKTMGARGARPPPRRRASEPAISPVAAPATVPRRNSNVPLIIALLLIAVLLSSTMYS